MRNLLNFYSLSPRTEFNRPFFNMDIYRYTSSKCKMSLWLAICCFLSKVLFKNPTKQTALGGSGGFCTFDLPMGFLLFFFPAVGTHFHPIKGILNFPWMLLAQNSSSCHDGYSRGNSRWIKGEGRFQFVIFALRFVPENAPKKNSRQIWTQSHWSEEQAMGVLVEMWVHHIKNGFYFLKKLTNPCHPNHQNELIILYEQDINDLRSLHSSFPQNMPSTLEKLFYHPEELKAWSRLIPL